MLLTIPSSPGSRRLFGVEGVDHTEADRQVVRGVPAHREVVTREVAGVVVVERTSVFVARRTSRKLAMSWAVCQSTPPVDAPDVVRRRRSATTSGERAGRTSLLASSSTVGRDRRRSVNCSCSISHRPPIAVVEAGPCCTPNTSSSVERVAGGEVQTTGGELRRRLTGLSMKPPIGSPEGAPTPNGMVGLLRKITLQASVFSDEPLTQLAAAVDRRHRRDHLVDLDLVVVEDQREVRDEPGRSTVEKVKLSDSSGVRNGLPPNTPATPEV
jgi:hypothetical protein